MGTQRNKYGMKRVEFQRELGTDGIIISSQYLTGTYYTQDYRLAEEFTARQIKQGFAFVSDDLLDCWQADIDFYSED